MYNMVVPRLDPRWLCFLKGFIGVCSEEAFFIPCRMVRFFVCVAVVRTYVRTGEVRGTVVKYITYNTVLAGLDAR